MIENFTQLNSDCQYLIETFGEIKMGLAETQKGHASMSIEETLAERGSRYGDFKEHARITQNIKKSMADSPNWSALSDDKKEALDMIAHKLGRILNGDPEYADSWHDIIGYTKLVEDALVL